MQLVYLLQKKQQTKQKSQTDKNANNLAFWKNKKQKTKKQQKQDEHFSSELIP